MKITTIGAFVLFLMGVAVYYRLPVRAQWKFLLLMSLAFVVTYKPLGLIFILCSALSIWLAGKKLDSNGKENKHSTVQNKKIVSFTVLFNISILIVLKYIGDIFGKRYEVQNVFSMLIPVGLSYYTLQAVGYILDIYWGRIHAEQSYLKIVLFLTYFPQMLQGPISRYNVLSAELFEKKHYFSMRNIKFGLQRMLWGYFKVLAMAPIMGNYVNSAFYGEETAYGYAAFMGLLFFGFQLYCNFSGGIDIVIGMSECMGIILPENFNQPFFSRSLGEFWRRWHITLGAWMKDYVFYPFSMSNTIKSLKKKLKKYISRKTANRIAIAIANILVFLLVGIWHGTGTNYALWGLYNGIILAVSEMLTDPFQILKSRLHIKEENYIWNLCKIIRTFFIVTLGWCTDCALTAKDSISIIVNIFNIRQTNMAILDNGRLATAEVVLFLFMLLLVGIMHEKKIMIRNTIEKYPIFIQLIFWTLFIQMCVFLGNSGADGGLMYANF